jgi:hypothetical protein
MSDNNEFTREYLPTDYISQGEAYERCRKLFFEIQRNVLTRSVLLEKKKSPSFEFVHFQETLNPRKAYGDEKEMEKSFFSKMLKAYSQSFSCLNGSTFSLNELDYKLFLSLNSERCILKRFVMIEKCGWVATYPSDSGSYEERKRQREMWRLQSVENRKKQLEQRTVEVRKDLIGNAGPDCTGKTEIDETIDYYLSLPNVEF